MTVQTETMNPPAPTAPASPAPAGTATEPAAGTGRPAAGSPEALRADLARERDRRQAAEAEAKALRESQAAAQREAETAETTRVRQELQQQLSATQAQLSQALAGRTLDQARIAAQAAGVEAGHVDTFLRLVDLSSIAVRSDGQLDTDAIGTAVQAGLEAAPMFKPPLPGGTYGARRATPTSGAGAGPAPAGDLNAAVAAKVAAMQAAMGRTATA